MLKYLLISGIGAMYSRPKQSQSTEQNKETKSNKSNDWNALFRMIDNQKRS